VLVNIKAAALNARDLMVVAHDPIYHIGTVEGLSPCSDGAGVIAKIGERERGKEPGCWKVGDRVVLCANLGWKYKEWPVLAELKGRGAGDVMRTLREWVIVVSSFFVFMNPLSSDVTNYGTKNNPRTQTNSFPPPPTSLNPNLPPSPPLAAQPITHSSSGPSRFLPPCQFSPKAQAGSLFSLSSLLQLLV
jgi:hypothetical protein